MENGELLHGTDEEIAQEFGIFQTVAETEQKSKMSIAAEKLDDKQKKKEKKSDSKKEK